MDPICGMTVDESSPLRAERDGQTFYFCSEHCRQKFLAQAAPAVSGGHACCGHNEAHAGRGDRTQQAAALQSKGQGAIRRWHQPPERRFIAKAVALSGSMMRNIRQLLFFTSIYNALGVPVAAGLLYPFFGLLLSPIIAGAAMSLSSVSVIANALRLRKTRL